ncbi:threonine--tRNA ligase [Spiroplasma culicicola]|uniref:Threonine--tRNA ligase n=1 Tax=Spiroplasma culicicola AES-1 TaxID=1276246 RepID=W6AFV1_9MOLU|nr:threonine--tRNA ligase [Spiroplasma culicicola]AHI52589.1 threonyl-tRNA synthetase [Spiroplasma culicicola AES-1]
MKVTLLDGQIKNYDQPMKVIDIAGDIAISLRKKCVGAVVNGKEVVPINAIINRDCKLELVTERHELYRGVINYTAKIVISLAIKTLFPLGSVAPQVDDILGDDFSVYFDYPTGLKQEDLQKIENRANEIIAQGSEFVFGEKTVDDYIEMLKRMNVKQEYIDSTIEQSNSKYIKYAVAQLNGIPFLSRYAHLLKTSDLFRIELTGLNGAYWEGDASNPMIYRIQGITDVSEERFNKLKDKLEEIKQSDHKYIAKKLEIYHLDPLIGQGLPIWLPNGTIVKQEIKKYLMEKEFEYDFIQIETPVIGTSELYKTSGHWDHYREDMFAPMQLPKEEMVLKPMSCPHHISVYNYKQRSYKDLPLRFAEHALQHRYESSGSLTGLERVRAMELTDSHIFVRPDQVKEEFIRCFNLIQEVLATFDIKVDYLSLSLRDPKDKEKYFDDDKMWNHAEQELESVLEDLKLDYKKMVGEAAFYGPKLDIQAKTALGHEITVSTIQLDFLLPQKFDLGYIGKNGETLRPIMIHRGLVGTYERFISVLLEQTKGVLPLWCSPKQVEIIPVNIETNLEYANEIKDMLKASLIRTGIDLKDERLSYKIREAQVSKIPYLLVLGEKEQADRTVTYRTYGSEKQITVKIEEFIELLNKKIKQKSYN